MDKDLKEMKDKLEMKTQMKSADVAKYLIGLADGFKAGRIVVEQGTDSLVLLPAVLAEVEVEARVKKDKARFTLEVSWRTACEEDSEELTISAGKPEKAEKKEEKKPVAKIEAKKEAKPEAKKEEPKKPAAAAPVAKVEAKPVAPAAKVEAKADVKPEAAKPAAPATPNAPAAPAAPVNQPGTLPKP